MKKAIILCLVWILFVYYPNPMVLAGSVARFANPIDSEAVQDFSDIMPDKPAEIERLVENYIQVETDWSQYNVPWYFPSAEEVVNTATGDCKHRAVLLASVLEAKGIEYEFKFSITHFWVNYEGKQIGAFEEVWESGKLPPLEKTLKNYKDYIWDAVPLNRQILLIVGPIFILLISLLKKRK